MIFDTGHSEYDAMSTENRKKSTTFYAGFKKVSKKFLTTVKYSVMKIKKEVYLEIFSNIFLSL